jgi:hypothetical protein
VRSLALGLVALALALPVGVSAASKPPAGALSIEGGKGVVVIRGNGGLLGRVGHGSVEIVDLSPGDSWRPAVNGAVRSRKSTTRGSNVTFRILGGEYRVTIKGEGISVSARGAGAASLLGVPNLFSSDTGIYSSDLEADCQDTPEQCQAIPTILTRVPFGKEPGGKPDTSNGAHS